MSGPINVDASSGSPILTCAYADSRRRTTSGSIDSRRRDYRVDIGIFRNDDRVVSGALQQAAPESSRDDLRDLPAHCGRSRERHQRDARVRGEARSGVASSVDQEREDRRQVELRDDSIAQVLDRDCSERRLR
jgi:hypothetical protein